MLSVLLALVADFAIVLVQRCADAVGAGGGVAMNDGIFCFLLDPANWLGAATASSTGPSST